MTCYNVDVFVGEDDDMYGVELEVHRDTFRGSWEEPPGETTIEWVYAISPGNKEVDASDLRAYFQDLGVDVDEVEQYLLEVIDAGC